MNQVSVISHNHLLRNPKFISRRITSSYDNRNRYNEPFNNRSMSVTTNNRSIVLHFSHNPKYLSQSTTPPQQNSINKFRTSPQSSNSLSIANQVVDISEEIFQAASLDNTVTDDQFLNYCNFFDIGIVETTNLIRGIQPNTIWYFPSKIALRNQHRKLN